MAVSVTGPRAVNELGGPVIPGNEIPENWSWKVMKKSWNFISRYL